MGVFSRIGTAALWIRHKKQTIATQLRRRILLDTPLHCLREATHDTGAEDRNHAIISCPLIRRDSLPSLGVPGGVQVRSIEVIV